MVLVRYVFSFMQERSLSAVFNIVRMRVFGCFQYVQSCYPRIDSFRHYDGGGAISLVQQFRSANAALCGMRVK